MVEIKFGSWAPNHHCKNIGRFKFGGLVRDRHMYIFKYEILADFSLVVARQTAKLPNLIPRQIFQLYGMSRGKSITIMASRGMIYRYKGE